MPWSAPRQVSSVWRHSSCCRRTAPAGRTGRKNQRDTAASHKTFCPQKQHKKLRGSNCGYCLAGRRLPAQHTCGVQQRLPSLALRLCCQQVGEALYLQARESE
jgi:hypothetical protein